VAKHCFAVTLQSGLATAVPTIATAHSTLTCRTFHDDTKYNVSNENSYKPLKTLTNTFHTSHILKT